MSFTQEKTIESRQCRNCTSQFEITDKDLEFYDKISPVFSGEKYSVLIPTFCPKCRQQRRLSFQNMMKLYNRECNLTKRKIISNFSPDKAYKVYNQNDWWSDKFDGLEYARDFDCNRGFFEQFDELYKEVPTPSLFTEFTKDVNCSYTNFSGYNKNCYLIFHADFDEDCLYAVGLKNSKKCVDSLNVFDSENTYQSINCKNSFTLKYSQDCNNCSESTFLIDCIGCKNCFGCIGLQNAQYHIFNEKKTKEEYELFMENIDTGNYSETQNLHQQFQDFQKKNIYKSFHGLQNENISGDHVFDCKNVQDCFDIQESRDMKYCERIYNGPNEDCYDVDQYGLKISRVYESANIGLNCEGVISSAYAYSIINVYYSLLVFYSSDCFGCVGLKNKQYCIFNKQYTKEEYNILVPKIINHMKETGEWGEFFPSNISPFGYNETVAQEYFPLEKQEALNGDFNWSDYEADFQKVDKIIPASKLPDNISDIPDDILNWAIECEITKKPFRITPEELEFYRQHKLPIPRRHPDQRHLDRMKLRNPRKLYKRDCDKCGVEMQTTYAPEREESVYCEECYNKEIY